MTYSIIKKSQLEGALRLDAEYYQPEFLELEKKIFGMKFRKIKEVTIIKSGVTPKDRNDSLNQGVILLKTNDIRNNVLNLKDDYYFISEEIDDCMKSTRLKSDDVLVSIVGANLSVVGRIGFVPKEFPKANITQAMAFLRTKSSSFLQEYIFAFLISKLGRLQLDRLARPTGQYNINLEELGRVKLPLVSLASQKEISNIILESNELQEKSNQYYQEAEEMLLEELELNNFQKDDGLFSIVNLSEVQKANRIDAEYFQEKYNKLVEKISSKSYKKLGDLVSMRKGFEPGAEAYQEKGKSFIRVSNLTKLGINDSNQQYLNEELYSKLKKDFEPQVGEILLSKDATPGIAYTIKESNESIISSGILRLKVKNKIEPEYITLVINSLVGQMQAERDAGGSVIAHWKPEQIKNILIPILSTETQQKIAELVRQSHIARQKSKKLLEEAKRKVEELIERGKL
ncbi:MAG: methylase-type I restriction-modification system protein [Berkelbacteria bacterium GW2011_GWA1_36_9]|uniref:Methylase-type I restriction-modification system protein n=1 Tax=Berkelbacteria bacterium GW2011_GWA1_36_9 TaxID=1618331 RepID=A0A0G0FKH0_9BACT|nr:MAG: methylase-type I restriction-modification system protein [Berkelbacteria bacterium GW2011_GWA1_36_9]